MANFITAGGPFMWFILLLGGLALLLTASHVIGFINGDYETASKVSGINTILYLGIAAFVIGVTTQLTGLYMAANAIIHAESISPPIIAEGILVSFNSTLLGLIVLAFSFLFWLGVRFLLPSRETRQKTFENS